MHSSACAHPVCRRCRNTVPSEIHVNEERSLSRGIIQQEHSKGFNWDGFHRGNSWFYFMTTGFLWSITIQILHQKRSPPYETHVAFSTLKNSRSSSRLVLRKKLPNAVSRLQSAIKLPFSSYLISIVLNLKILKGLPCRPGLL